MRRLLPIAAWAICLASPAFAQPVTVRAAPAIGAGPLSGRLLVFATKAEPGTATPETIDISPFEPTSTAVFGRDVRGLNAGEQVAVDVASGFPGPLTTLPAGTYRFQALLDRDGNYQLAGRGEGDLVSRVVDARLPGPVPELELSRALPGLTDEDYLRYQPETERAGIRAAMAEILPLEMVSPRLSSFWGRPVAIRGWVALPPGYGRDSATYPTVFTTGGINSSLFSQRGGAARMARLMKVGEAPPMIWVYLDHSLPTGTHEFADSVNNGPWGEALTAEFIPWFDGRYRTDGRAGTRFLTGHSSGGWSTLWLQTRYPGLFGGTWSTAPDPSDFHDFTNVDIYAPNANAFTDASGRAVPLVRKDGRVLATFQQFAQLEEEMGVYGGQLASFEWVFSPKGPDGRPMPLFDRLSGRVDPAVAAYWRDNYDIAYRVARDWPQLRSDLDGKINVIVGAADTFYLDQSARRLQAVLDRLGARSRFTYVPGGTHGSIFTRLGDRNALLREIAWEMYTIARPGAPRRQPGETPAPSH